MSHCLSKRRTVKRARPTGDPDAAPAPSASARTRATWKGGNAVSRQHALGRRILRTRRSESLPARQSAVQRVPTRPARRVGDGRDALCASVVSGLWRRGRSKRCAVLGAMSGWRQGGFSACVHAGRRARLERGECGESAARAGTKDSRDAAQRVPTSRAVCGAARPYPPCAARWGW